MFHKRAGCRGCDLEAVAKSQAMANSIGPARFAFQVSQSDVSKSDPGKREL